MERQQRIFQPQTIISIIAFVFSLGGVWATLNNRIRKLEDFQKQVDITKIETKLTQIQVDLERVKKKLEEK